MLAPGLWLQRLTTREPTLDQIEVSIRALQEVLRVERTDADSRVEVMAVARAAHRAARERRLGGKSRARQRHASAQARARSKTLEYSNAVRIGKGNEGKTSPEELLAAAHAACLATSLAGELTRAGSPPERIDVTANVVMDEVEGKGHLIVESQVRVRGACAGYRRGRVSSRRRG